VGDFFAFLPGRATRHDILHNIFREQRTRFRVLTNSRRSHQVQLCPEAHQRKLCFMDTELLTQFVEQVNNSRNCATPGCNGNLVPVSVTSKGLGGALSVTYVCNGCKIQEARFDTSYLRGNTSEVCEAVKVAFIVSGCTHATYCKALQHTLGLNAVCAPSKRCIPW